MYGTVARFRLLPGKEGNLAKLQEFSGVKAPGEVAAFLYRMDNDPQEYYLSVVFKDKESYLANANSPEQDARYREMRALMERDPEWHDGEVVYGS